ncbi:hypothetical protein ALC53_10529 [Atta colombica]|uniref:Uncharacterized protein n=1 Tax=Atta colombica TaxID=520822 RepID=A0A195B3X2_9HYME|nr:hypothetical protein ALC53_10529 [Atta colombica]
MVMKISASEAGVPLLGAVGPRYVVKQATVKRCVLALLLVSIASIFYYTYYIVSSGPLSRWFEWFERFESELLNSEPEKLLST